MVVVVNAYFLVDNKQVSFRHRIALACILLILLASAIYLYQYNPDGSNVYPTCPFHSLTGLHCPGCGSIRALHQIMHGNILAAFNLNPLMVLFTPLLGWIILSQLCVVIRARPLPRLFIPAFFIWILFAVIIIYWILRNIPVFPVNILAP